MTKATTSPHDDALRAEARRLKGHARRVFMAAVALAWCGGSARRAERRFGWTRATVGRGLGELLTGQAHQSPGQGGRQRTESLNPGLAEAIHTVCLPHSWPLPGPKLGGRLLTIPAGQVLALLRGAGWAAEQLPSERTMRTVLRRLNYRPARRRKPRPSDGPPVIVLVQAPGQQLLTAGLGLQLPALPPPAQGNGNGG